MEDFMKVEKLFGFAIFFIILAAFCSCQSSTPPVAYNYQPVTQSETQTQTQTQTQVQTQTQPQPVEYQPDSIVPLTPYIISRLSDNNRLPPDIKRFQFALSGSISIENEYTQVNDRVLSGGRVRFEDILIRDSIVINDRTEGQASSIEIFGSDTVISVCFERDDKNQLVFSTMPGEAEEYFYLRFNPVRNQVSYSNDEKGTIEYGGNTYRLKYNGDRPYLMIMLTQQDTVKLNSRTAEGRRIN